MANKLSFTQIKTYSECGTKFKLHYVDRLRNKTTHAALLFGSAIDEALNTLLLEKDLNKSINSFEKKWNFQWINGKITSLPTCKDIVYANTDLDEELLSVEDIQKLNDSTELGDYKQKLNSIKERKDQFGWANLDDTEKEFYNYVSWLSLRHKGHIMLHSYNEKIIPKIKEVLAVQHKTSLINQDGDEVMQVLDIVLVWEDGSKILMDNKTSARDYDSDSAGTSQQLISYYHKAKTEFGVNAVGFIVIKKQIQKNKTKICSKCKHDGSESKARTCDVEYPGMVIKRNKEVEGMVRCNGSWDVTMNPEAIIYTVINNVTPEAEDLVLSTFDEANEGISKGYYQKNLSACKQGSIICPFYAHCWKNDDSDLIKLEDKKS